MQKLKCKEPAISQQEELEHEQIKFSMKDAGFMVQDHYTDLPYPPFDVFDMTREMAHYQEDKNAHPIKKQYGNSLSIISHYLFNVSISFHTG